MAARKGNYTLGGIVPGIASDCCTEVLSGVQEAPTAKGCSLVNFPVKHAEKETCLWGRQFCCRVDGIVMIGLTPPGSVRSWLSEKNVPLVVVNAEAHDTSRVVFDHAAAASTAVQRLVGLGHRRIAFVDDAEEVFPSDDPGARQRGYYAALAEANLSHRKLHECVVDRSSQTMAAMLDDWLRLPDPPTAILAGSDRHALAIVHALRRGGRRVPEDLAVVGYGDTMVARYLGLTTVRVPLHAMGSRAVALLLLAIAQPQAPAVPVRMSPELIVRATCGAPGGMGAD